MCTTFYSLGQIFYKLQYSIELDIVISFYKIAIKNQQLTRPVLDRFHDSSIQLKSVLGSSTKISVNMLKV